MGGGREGEMGGREGSWYLTATSVHMPHCEMPTPSYRCLKWCSSMVNIQELHACMLWAPEEPHLCLNAVKASMQCNNARLHQHSQVHLECITM